MHKSSARWAGLLLFLTGIATVVSVAARVSAGADQPTLEESLAVIAQNQAAYFLGGAARLVSGIALIFAGSFVYRALGISQSVSAKLMLVLFILSGLFTALSGGLAMALAQIAPGATELSGATTVASGASWMYDLRWLTGTVGFTAAGLALGAAAWAYPKTGRAAWVIVRASAAIGIAMLFIWIDAATAMHRISGIAFLLWLIGMGSLFLSGGPTANEAESDATPPLVQPG